MIALAALPDVPEIRPGDDLAAILGEAASRLEGGLKPTDVLAVAHKVVSKAERRVVRLAEVFPGWQALELAEQHGKDPHHMQVILDEAQEVLRADRGRHHLPHAARLRVRQRRRRRVQHRPARHASCSCPRTRTLQRARCGASSAARS